MRKWILLLLTALCIVSGALAEELDLPPTRYAPGEEVPLRLYVTAPGLAGLQMRLTWDAQVLELADTEPELAAFFSEDAMLSMVYAEPEDGVLTIVWLRETDVSLTDVCMLEFTLRVREAAVGGVSAAGVAEYLLADMQGEALATQAEGVEIEIDAPLAPSAPAPTETPEPTPAPEASASPEPTPTAEPAVAFIWLTDTLLPVAEASQPTVTPGQYIPSRPNDAADMVEVTPAPTAEPTQTPAPTPVTVVIGATPSPVPQNGKLHLRVTETADGFRVELIAQDVTIGGLQATIDYDPSAASCTGAAFTDAIRNSAMVQMVNRDVEGRIRLVYASISGYQAAGEAIFTADFTAKDAQELVLTLTDVKCTGADAELSMWQMDSQETVWRIQPMDDLTEEKGAGVQ